MLFTFNVLRKDIGMANVFTKKYGRPRTTTLRDFSFRDLPDRPRRPRRPRILSPTRRCNPHPTGLVYQSPYNRDNQTFGIWNPDFLEISRRMPQMIGHLERANFCSGPILLPPKDKVFPEIHYDLNTTTRLTYQTPEFPENVVHDVKTTRFGHRPYKPAKGIVPNTLPPISPPPSRNQ